MRNAAQILVGLVVLGSTAPALASTYSWTDAQGTVHFTDNAARAVGVGSARREPAAQAQSELPAAQPVRPVRPAQAVLGAMLPTPTSGEIRIPFVREGQLIRLQVRLNHRIEVPFYLDTGSSGIVLPRAYAERLSLDLGSEVPRVTLRTTAGPIQVPAVQLDSVQLGSAELENLEATISPSLEIGLLGGGFLNQFSYSIDPVAKVLVLRRLSSPE